ncbi:hypothetical protein A3D05_04925 [Candidatus Gottesmanbacteria bacterium RIFCSPHIGHO2_02_FULL_40_24]|uniref:DUF4012 domain-containing protein n=1 Tax=Candidatus Gottesmanbacteria bacterium RIFCSPHIGHO2_01_FULL_40_15 TaxID=1798376 RepID=A0A1F5Z287_9BACT|nr:MAG: hypothetical protein A2777_05955 [Candidatus Gottesmanbacteria bacterium RIFCSPHIGHO2_01_FULL_40_15]OGG16214.1 MAG: hypothetical protein A3D05_04925 [Candidatus Gottesmanbacteria bacterium RIFCSPHIGHO2_02_FULL_40_24]OGG32297.1 MAG: hypothetical protein A3I80_03265 [Candidatus Gottesmanbacteria bacterium RIFCSPLOWO2_02_FULL_40_10]
MNRNFRKIKFNENGAVSVKNVKIPLFLSKKGKLLLAFFIALLFIFFLAVFFPARQIASDVQKVRASGSRVYEHAKNQDLDKVSTELEVFRSDLIALQSSVNKLNFLGILPGVGRYQQDSRHLAAGAVYASEALKETVQTLMPYSDLLGLKGQSTFVSGSADDRIRTAVETIEKIVPNIDKIGRLISLAEKEISSVDFNRYPQRVAGKNVRSSLISGKKLFSETAVLFTKAQPFLKNLPDILGNKESKKYLFLFQNDAELRATGGFLTAYAIFNVDKGKLTVERSDDIYKLDEAKKKQFPAPEKILTYHKGVTNFHLRDSNLSPDFSVSMATFEKLLKDSSVDLGTYDGIIALDTHVLVSTIEILGDFNINGRTFSAETDKRCNCPKVIYELEDYATRPVAYVREDRKGIIGSLLYEIMHKALGVSPSQYWGKLFQMFIDEANQKHILFLFKNEDAQKGIEALNFAGKIMAYDGDYLHINNVNFAGAKSNLYVKNYVTQEIQNKENKIEKTLTLTYKNPAPASNCNLEAGQLCLNGILRNWLRVYVPRGSKLLEFKGSEMDVKTYDELDKTVFEGFLTVKPQGSAEAKIVYRLPENFPADTPYKILIQKQPGTGEEEFTIKGQGREEKLILNTDREIIFN